MMLSIARLRRRCAAGLGTLAFALLAATGAAAVPVTVTMTGHLTAVPTTLAGAFAPGQSFSFSYTYNTTTGNAGGPSNAIYYYQGSHLDVGGGAFTVDAPAGAVFANSIQIVNLSSFDAYKVDATDNLVYSPSALIAPYLLSQVFIQFTYGPGTFSGPALPVGAPPYTTANGFSMQFRLDPNSLDGRVFVDGKIDTVTDDVAAQVPAPAGLLLLASGLAGLAALRRRTRR